MSRMTYDDLQAEIGALDQSIYAMANSPIPGDPQDHNEMFQSPADRWHVKLAELQSRRAALVARRDAPGGPS